MIDFRAYQALYCVDMEMSINHPRSIRSHNEQLSPWSIMPLLELVEFVLSVPYP